MPASRDRRRTLKGDRILIFADLVHFGHFSFCIMARLARVVVAGYPYHLTHRGNRRADVFLSPEDRDVYRKWLRQYATKLELDIWAHCLMTNNHVHLLVVPRRDGSLAKAIGQTHMPYPPWVSLVHANTT